MIKWFTLCLEVCKVTVTFCVCLIIFYYGILWLNESYDGDERLNNPQKNAHQVQSIPVEEECCRDLQYIK